MKTHRFVPSIFYYTYGSHTPALTIHSGDTVVAETRDAFGFDSERNPLPNDMKQSASGTTLKDSNPVVGPIYVEEAEEGDLLSIDIDKIRVNRDFALSRQDSHFGSLTGEHAGKKLLYNDPIPEIWYEWTLDIERGLARLDLPESQITKVEVPFCPFIGSIGVAPRYGRVETTLTPGEFGGNMDFREITAGTTLLLPVWVKGAYLSFGDVHALQGDGEVNGTALEVTAEVTLKIDVIKGNDAEWPRLIDSEFIMVIGSARPLMDCIRISQMSLLSWLTTEYGFHREEAWQLMAQVGEIRIANIVDPAYTAASKFPKRYLPGL
jgi:acetamidase/formamidase